MKVSQVATLLVCVALPLLGAGCTQGAAADTRAETAPTPAYDSGESSPRTLAPLGGEWLEKHTTDKGVAFVSVPNGAREPRPMVVALHGGGDRPEWACGEWRGVTTAYAFIVCPQGTGSVGAFFWSSPKQVADAVDAGIATVRKQYPGYVLDGPVVLVGFSAGAIQAALLAQGQGSRFSRIVLAEGAYETTREPGFAAAFARSGGKRVLLGCTTHGICEPSFRSALSHLKRAGVEARLNHSGNQGHGLNARSTWSLRQDWSWFVEGLQGWEGYRVFTPDPMP